MRLSIVLLFLGPMIGLAGIIASCPPSASHCTYGASETIAGNVVTIDFSAVSDRGGSFQLNETLLTDGLAVVGSGYIGLVNLSLAAGVIGSEADGAFGQYSCEANTLGMPFGPDTPVHVASCFSSGSATYLTSDVVIPISMNINLSPGGFGRVFLQAAFFEMDTATGQTRPLALQFQVPEPGSLSLFGIGLAGLLFLRRSRNQLPAGRLQLRCSMNVLGS